ncbi:hepatitis A virus cellular receptor 2-like isoform X2 [Parambassis ranga]|uniref:Hepatitis A virus cellular receptor 2-like isoform X2 n=1 Tax=Parambassis ranga TaxID=210632 RepID=A0A6P7I184_9TELE|nr:hepatitis A virus cellular receptor 2-like isoform X2 [Parambassis ranga]
MSRTFLSVYLFASVFALVCPDSSELNITAEPGQTVTLPCAATNLNIAVVKWTKDGLEGYIMLYRDEHFENASQLPSFKERVELKKGWKEDGNVSLILQNVTTADSGTYECEVVQEGKKAADLICNITLSVDPAGGDKRSRGRIGLYAAIALAVIVGCLALWLI